MSFPPVALGSTLEEHVRAERRLQDDGLRRYLEVLADCLQAPSVQPHPGARAWREAVAHMAAQSPSR